MFRLWGSNPRGGDKTVETGQTSSRVFLKELSDINTDFSRPLKRKAYELDDCAQDASGPDFEPSKRARIDYSVATPPETPAVVRKEYFSSQPTPMSSKVERAVEAIRLQFGVEILMKHQELRLISQELAKCQIALEQLRRCHLIPYPTNCPTPEQMVAICEGKGPAVQTKPGEPVPQWAPPFGVVDGPYARHYAKWLIPDPKFDGLLPDWHGIPYVGKNAAEGRTTRNSFAEGTIGRRVARGQSSQKLHSGLPAGYPQAKDKSGPCILKRPDGETVKLVCIDCNRENFSSTQGFINHCRIAHKRDYKSHGEAAMHCGHPITVNEGGAANDQEKSSMGSAPGEVKPLARSGSLSENEAYASLAARVRASLELYRQGKLPGVTSIPGAPSSTPVAKATRKPSKSFVGASATPYLSQMMQEKGSRNNLAELVADAKTKVNLDEALLQDEDSEDGEDTIDTRATKFSNKVSSAARVPVTMRVPARASSPSAPSPPAPSLPADRMSGHPTFGTSSGGTQSSRSGDMSVRGDDESVTDDADLMDVDLSPNTVASNNAPSLVSDDGEYDDSDDDGTSSTGEGIDNDSDVAEIKLDEESEVLDSQSIRHHRSSASTGMKLKKDESKHVTFVTPIDGSHKGRRKQNLK